MQNENSFSIQGTFETGKRAIEDMGGHIEPKGRSGMKPLLTQYKD